MHGGAREPDLLKLFEQQQAHQSKLIHIQLRGLLQLSGQPYFIPPVQHGKFDDQGTLTRAQFLFEIPGRYVMQTMSRMRLIVRSTVSPFILHDCSTFLSRIDDSETKWIAIQSFPEYERFGDFLNRTPRLQTGAHFASRPLRFEP
jgi:hypothetical protein